MLTPSSDARQLATFLLEKLHTIDAQQRALLLRVLSAPHVEESDLREVERLAGQFVRQRRSAWRRSRGTEPA
jgi:hypothetical protein